VSIGVAVYPDLAGDVDELCSHADVAMYDAKTSGRNRVSVYSPRLQQRVLRFPRDWRDRITSALNEERLELYEQPIINPRDGTVAGHELLIRLLSEDGTPIPAKHFIPFAEQSGLIQGIDQWVAHEAMGLARRLQATGSRQYLAFNLSRWAFVDPEMLDLLRREIAATGIDPHLIVVEMTETSALADMNSAERFMSGLRSSGCRFALDDFGVGYSSFHHLKRLPVDFLKIDGSFVRDITHNRADREIVSAMVKMADGLGLQAVAEAVHSEAVLDVVREIGVPFAQGYWIARPRPASRLFPVEAQHDGEATLPTQAA
jgi:EAL domain-containing protein (putative c-di-GMP-specific phosphodiesterase class I)